MKKPMTLKLIAMKPITVAIAFTALALPALAQPEPVLIDSRVESGGYGGAALKLVRIDEQLGWMLGGSAAWVLKGSFILGGGGYGLTSTISTDAYGADSSRIGLGYGGGILGYQFASGERINYGAQVLVGVGTVRYRAPDDEDDTESEFFDRRDGFFVVEPGVTAEMKLMDRARLHLEGSYRIVDGVDLPGLSNSTLGGPSVTLTLRMGIF